MMRILALDLATATGWACGSHHPVPVTHGVLRLPKTGDNIGRFLGAFREWLGHAIEEMAPTEVWFEAPNLPKLTNVSTVRKLNGLVGFAETIAQEDYKLEVREANNWDIREHFVGVKMAPKSVPQDQRRKWIKDKVMAECRKRGFRVAGDDDADALALLSYALTLKHPGFILQAVTEARAA